MITGLWLRSCLYDLASLLGSWFSRDSIIHKFINKEIFTFALKPVNSPTFVDIFKHVFQVLMHRSLKSGFSMHNYGHDVGTIKL